MTTVGAEKADNRHGNVNMVVFEGQEIKLTATGQTLSTILSLIQKQSMIRFKISAELQKKPITEAIRANDWQGIIKGLLSNYNRVEIWDTAGNLQMVTVLSSVATSLPESSPQALDNADEIMLEKVPFLPDDLPPPPH
jgi:hypothetical protein